MLLTLATRALSGHCRSHRFARRCAARTQHRNQQRRRRATRTRQHRLEDSSATTNCQSFHQQAGEIANLEGRRYDSHLKRDPSCRDLPHESGARQNRPGGDDC